MKVSVEWLKEYVDPPAAPQDLAKLLVMAGVGVESVEGDVLDLELTANRADLLSMLGVAREVGVLTGKPIRVPHEGFAHNSVRVQDTYTVTVRDMKLCPRYTARAVHGVKVGASPAWMAARLEK